MSPSTWLLFPPTASEWGNAATGGVWLTIAAACGPKAVFFGARQFLALAVPLRPE